MEMENELFFMNHVTVGIEFIETYTNKEGVLCLKGVNKCKATEFDRLVDNINKYFTFRLTNKSIINRSADFKNGDYLLVDGHLKVDAHIRPNGGITYKMNLYADSIMPIEVTA